MTRPKLRSLSGVHPHGRSFQKHRRLTALLVQELGLAQPNPGVPGESCFPCWIAAAPGRMRAAAGFQIPLKTKKQASEEEGRT